MNAAPRQGRAQGPRVIVPRQETQANTLPVCEAVPRPNAPFTLVHAHQWEFCDTYGEGGAWLPEVNEIRHEPGCNGVTERGNPAAALIGHQRKHSVVIQNGDPRLPEGYRHYLASYDLATANGRVVGRFHCFPSVRFAFLQGGRAVKPVHDRSWEFEFRRALYDCGLVSPMSADVLETHLAMIRDRIRRARRLAAEGKLTPEALREQVAEHESRIERLRAAFGRQFGAAIDGPVTAGPRLSPTVDDDPIPSTAMGVSPGIDPAAAVEEHIPRRGRKRIGGDDA